MLPSIFASKIAIMTHQGTREENQFTRGWETNYPRTQKKQEVSIIISESKDSRKKAGSSSLLGGKLSNGIWKERKKVSAVKRSWNKRSFSSELTNHSWRRKAKVHSNTMAATVFRLEGKEKRRKLKQRRQQRSRVKAV